MHLSATRRVVCCAVIALAARTAGALTDYKFGVSIRNDMNIPCMGVPVQLQQAPGLHWGLVTDADGSTPFYPVDHSLPVMVTLAETQVTGGVLLGQRWIEDMPVPPPQFDSFDYRRGTNQPHLTTVMIRYQEPTSSGHHRRWKFMPWGNPSKYLFTAQVGQLLTHGEIKAYEAAYGVTLPSPATGGARLALVMRTGGGAIIPPNRLSLSVDCKGHGFFAAPQPYVVLVNGVVQSGPLTLNVTHGLWDSANQREYLTIDGTIERGDTLILLYPTAPAVPASKLVSQLPSLVGTSPASTGSDCIPTPPNAPPSWTCSPDVPSSTSCGAGTLVTSGCATVTIPNNSAKCGLPGVTHSSGWRGHWGGSVSIPVNINGVSVTLEGSYSY